ncbi:hypothetical protein HUG15_05790 [Salicibibacter cibarius]|uniref:Uncharacterized protein n=1 Tax=Salicibibacter cibarius TaxID=2743000 RepID=A0A7T6Z192_9BACI|nr:hypothetical protein [Salicibibacter cibarius]QQK75106.1 hypothetical protein HUG15_05460 [Salicibibacter cibarius]QQK75166.1 hypothetical protein HUG15_05790 [Salicibibacter cibarius]
MKEAIDWALENMNKKGIDSPKQHGFIDLVRRYFNENGIDHEPMNFQDVKRYLPDKYK